jgi:OmcA/MtrC family decaheme c-type cytochrome
VYQVWAAGTADTTVPCVVPASAKSPNCNGGLSAITPNAQKVATGYTARRPIVEDARCNACHQELGTFTQDAFHAGQRNDGTTCSWCHTPNKASSGWSADSTYFVHAIHAGAKREVPFHWDASSTTESFADIAYPGVLKDCQTCHLPGTYDFSASASASAAPNKQLRLVANGAFNGIWDPATSVGGSITNYTFSSGSCNATASAAQSALGFFELAPYIGLVTAPFNAAPTPTYGINYSFSTSPASGCTPDGLVYTIPAGMTPDNGDAVAKSAYGASLVNSPIAGVCFACHDSSADMAHFQLNGGAIYQPRSQAVKQTETCLICHGPGAIADIDKVHSP